MIVSLPNRARNTDSLWTVSLSLGVLWKTGWGGLFTCLCPCNHLGDANYEIMFETEMSHVHVACYGTELTDMSNKEVVKHLWIIITWKRVCRFLFMFSVSVLITHKQWWCPASWRRMWEELEVVCVCTPPHTHTHHSFSFIQQMIHLAFYHLWLSNSFLLIFTLNLKV